MDTYDYTDGFYETCRLHEEVECAARNLAQFDDGPFWMERPETAAHVERLYKIFHEAVDLMEYLRDTLTKMAVQAEDEHIEYLRNAEDMLREAIALNKDAFPQGWHIDRNIAMKAIKDGSSVSDIILNDGPWWVFDSLDVACLVATGKDRGYGFWSGCVCSECVRLRHKASVDY